MSYELIKKIHLYACLSTAAVLLMFILTSYLMIHHTWFNQEGSTESRSVEISLETDEDWSDLKKEHGIKGRLVNKGKNQAGMFFREYASASQSCTVEYDAQHAKAEIRRVHKSTANALVGIHRQRGYQGPFKYLVHAFLLDLIGISLIVFSVTGLIMWFKLLKHNNIAWFVFIGGLVYTGVTIALLMYW